MIVCSFNRRGKVDGILPSLGFLLDATQAVSALSTLTAGLTTSSLSEDLQRERDMVKSHCNVPCGVSTSRHYAMVPVAYRPVITHHFVPYGVFCPCGVSTSHHFVPSGVSTSYHFAMFHVAYRPVITHHFVPYSVFCPCGVSTNQHFVPCGVSTIYHFAMFHVAYLPAITLQYSMWLIKQPSHLLYSMRLIKLPSLCHVPCGLSNSNHFAMFHVAFGVSNSNHFAMFHVVHRPAITLLCSMRRIKQRIILL